ncbi:MAG: flagellar biosynthetic protein FliR [Sandaracinus sp.]|nr:flagellar biosynthetic protein FliR [Sandaracinus sp.]MCB9621925.1 flagellar biosynthetic protein FliR [Sandaracinus sp.]
MVEELARALSDEATLDRWILLGVLVAARIAPLTVVAPWLTLRRTPPFLRGALILGLTVALAPLAAGAASVDALFGADAATLVAWVIREVLVGTLFALATSLPFFALDWAGRLVDTWRGASMAEVIAPPTGERTSPVGDLQLMVGIVLFLTLGGHRLAFAAFAEGLVVAPPGSVDLAGSAPELALGAARLTGSALAFAVAIAAPAGVAIVLVETALGLVARSAPQIPVFFAGMPLRATVGLAAALLGLAVLLGELPGAFEDALAIAAQWMRDLAP